MFSSDVQELAPCTEKASRVEPLVRMLYGVVIGFVLAAWHLWNDICVSIQFLYILILGRRSPYFYPQTRRYIAAVAYTSSYLSYLTDSRPHLTPDKILYVTEAGYEAPKYIPLRQVSSAPPVEPNCQLTRRFALNVVHVSRQGARAVPQREYGTRSRG